MDPGFQGEAFRFGVGLGCLGVWGLGAPGFQGEALGFGVWGLGAPGFQGAKVWGCGGGRGLGWVSRLGGFRVWG